MRRMLILLIFFGFGLLCLNSDVFALDTKYNNKQGYINKIPYDMLFKNHTHGQIKIQKRTHSGKSIQAIVPVNKKEKNIKQKGLEK